jgi:hypothetical protein
VYRTGGDYDLIYVKCLVAGIRRSLSLPHKIVCLTDAQPEHLRACELDEVIPLSYSWPGWWAKMELFRLPGPLLYLDLDTVVVGNIDPLVEWVTQPENFLLMLRGFYRKDMCSGILGWNADMKWLFDSFIKDYANKATFRQRPTAIHMIIGREQFRGDQEWLRMFFKKEKLYRPIRMAQDVMPGIYSYTVNIQNNGALPLNSRIICFHGHPRPHELQPVPEWMQAAGYLWPNVTD